MKRFKIILIAITVFSLIAAYAYATSTITGSYTFSGSTMTFAPSNNVRIIAQANDTVYAAAAKHLNGDKDYGALSTSVKLQYRLATAGDSNPAAPTSSAALASGFTDL